MAYFSVVYTYGPDLATQDENRPRHRAYLAELAAKEQLVASGPLLENQPPRALLLFRAEDEQAVRNLLAADPFQQLGQVAETRIDQWNPVIGILAD